MTTPPLADVPIRSAEELTALWNGLLEPRVFRFRSLWLTWLDQHGMPLRILIPIEGLPRLPDNALLFNVLQVHEQLSAEDGHLALALCRPGRPEITEDDDAWVALLSEVLDDRIDGTWSLHLAAGGRITPLVDPPA